MKQIAILKKEARLAPNLPDKLAIQKKLRDIDKKRDEAWKGYDEASRHIEHQKDELLDTVEDRLKQTTEEIQPENMKGTTLDKSNFRQWQKLEPSASTEQILDQLVLHIDHIDAEATPEELFSVSDGALLLCLEESVTKELIDAVIELNPQQFLCLNSAFHSNDQLKANAVQTFNAHNMQKEKHNQILFKQYKGALPC